MDKSTMSSHDEGDSGSNNVITTLYNYTTRSYVYYVTIT